MQVEDSLNPHPFATMQLRVASLCGMTMFMAGFDAQDIGYVAPAIVDAWMVDRSEFGPVFAAGLIGIMVGALVGGPAADRIGRRPVLLASTLCFAVGSLFTISVNSIEELIVLRWLTCLGVGSAMPNAIALTSEYSPARRRTTVLMLMFCGYSLGAATAGVAAAAFTGRFGWTSVFLVGGAIPCLSVVLLWTSLPESLQYMAEQRRRRTLLTEPNLSTSGEERRFPIAQLFTAGRTSTTLLLWTVFFMNLLVLHFVTAWLPTIVRDSGVPLVRAILITATFQTGAVAAALPLGRLLDHAAPFRTLALVYCAAGVFLMLIGAIGSSLWLLFAAAFGAGVCILGGQLGANAIAAFVYPTSSRATGVGWALGIGRIGSIVGPIIGAWLLSLQWESRLLFALVTVPAVIAAAAAFGLHRLSRGVHPSEKAAQG